MGLNLLHAFANTLTDSGSAGTPGGATGPAEWNAGHQLYLDVNAQTGTSYALAAADLGALVTFNNPAAVAAAVPAPVAGQAAIGATLGCYRGWFCFVKNLGLGTVTFTPASGTINGNATETLAAGHFGLLISDGSKYQLLRNSLMENSTPLPQSYLAGGTTANDATSPNTVLDIAAVQARDVAGAVNIVTTATFFKSIGAAWAAGAGSSGSPKGGMGNGLSAAANTWYWLHAIINNGAADFYFDTSYAAANAPSGTTAYRPLWLIKTASGAATILPSTQIGDDCIWATPVADVAAASIGTAVVTKQLASVPPSVSVIAKLRASAVNAATWTVALLPGLDSGSTGSNGPTGNYNLTAAGGGSAAGNFELRTDASQNVKVAASAASTTLYVITYGWTWRRGRDT